MITPGNSTLFFKTKQIKTMNNKLNRREKQTLVVLPTVFILLVMFCGWFATSGIDWMDKTFPEFNPHTAVMQMEYSNGVIVQNEK